MNIEEFLEKELVWETKVFRENLPYNHFAHCHSHMTWPGIETGLQR
jgi:hypothetical protein